MEVGSSSLPGTTSAKPMFTGMLKCLGLQVFGGLAQLARAPALQAGGQRFESVILHSGHSGHPDKSIEIFDILTHETVE